MKEARAKEREFFQSSQAYADLKNTGACSLQPHSMARALPWHASSLLDRLIDSQLSKLAQGRGIVYTIVHLCATCTQARVTWLRSYHSI